MAHPDISHGFLEAFWVPGLFVKVVRARELKRTIEITITTGLRTNNIDKGKAPVNRFDKEMIFTIIVFESAKIFSQSQCTGNLE